MKDMIKQNTINIIWGLSGYFSWKIGSLLGNIPFSIIDSIYYNLSSVYLLKLWCIFFITNSSKLLIFFLMSLILNMFSTFSYLRFFLFLISFNYYPLIGAYGFYFTNIYKNIGNETVPYFLLSATPVISMLSFLLFLLGYHIGKHIRNNSKWF